MSGDNGIPATAMPRLISVRRAAELLRVSPKSVYRYIEQGRLRATYLSPRNLRVYEDSVLALIHQGDSHLSP